MVSKIKKDNQINSLFLYGSMFTAVALGAIPTPLYKEGQMPEDTEYSPGCMTNTLNQNRWIETGCYDPGQKPAPPFYYS